MKVLAKQVQVMLEFDDQELQILRNILDTMRDRQVYPQVRELLEAVTGAANEGTNEIQRENNG